MPGRSEAGRGSWQPRSRECNAVRSFDMNGHPNRFAEPGQPLIHPQAADRALRDLMPIVEWLTNADAAWAEGESFAAIRSLLDGFQAFRALPARSPAFAA